MKESLSEEIRIINNLLQKWTYVLFIQRKSICSLIHGIHAVRIMDIEGC